VPDLSHLWQRFVLAAVLVFGLLLGVGATIFGYSNTGTVPVGFAAWRLNAVPLWTVAIIPLILVLAAGTLYHWWNSLHHFTEHMRHRRRVRELEAEVSTLRAHLDQLLEMPDGTATRPAPKPSVVESLPVDTKPEIVSAPATTVPVNGEEPPTEKAS
jgi:uncharacterized integral membrane protein